MAFIRLLQKLSIKWSSGEYMWISEIELINFKSYVHQVFHFPEPSNGANLVLIGGMNGFGKTTLLEALYLCLYGMDAISHLGRAGLKLAEKGKGYPTFLERALNGRAIALNHERMSVKIQIMSGDGQGFEITRRWFFTRKGLWDGEEDVLLYDIKKGVRQAVDKYRLNELLDLFFVPAHLAPFFFFDGEEVKTLANRDRIEQIKVGMEGLLGVVLLRGLQKRLEQYQASTKSRAGGLSSIDDQKQKELEVRIASNEKDLSLLKDRRTMLSQELDTAKAKRDDLMERVMTLGGGGGDIATAGDIVRQQGDIKVRLDECCAQMERFLATKLPFHLVSREVIDDLREQIRREIKRRQWDAKKSSMETERARLVERFFDTAGPIVVPDLTRGQIKVLHERLNIAWESLFFPLPDDCAEEIVHDYLPDDKREALLNLFEGLRQGARGVRRLVKTREDLERQLRDLERRYAKLEGIDRDGTLAQINESLSTVNLSIEKLERDRGDLDRQITSLCGSIDQDKATYGRIVDVIVKASPAKSNIAKAQRIRDLIEELIPSLYTLKTQQLSEAMTNAYRRLAHKGQIGKIEIDETGATRLLAKDGTAIEFDRSAGENQLFATALLSGLAEVSGIKAPLVVDTPLARLDSSHRKNILDFWTSDQSRQVILLTQDKEIDAEMLARIQSTVGKRWLLEHHDLGSGVGRTTATEDAFFGEGND